MESLTSSGDSLYIDEIQYLMRAFMKLIVVIFLLISSLSFAAEGDKGIGVMLGNPTGLSGKYWLDETKAVDAGVGFSVGSATNLTLHSDFLLHSIGALVMNDIHPLDVYCGLGGRVKFADDIQIGLRVPVGVAYKAPNNASDMFAEIAPVIDFISRTGIDLNVLIGARYYFN
jgi:hypothetical protein